MILLLAGTTEARNLAGHLASSGVKAVASLAGVTEEPLAYPIEIRTGGFGGEEGFRSYLREAGITAVIDATHPFAEAITTRTARICLELGLPYLRYERKIWRSQPGDAWHHIDSYEALPDMIPTGARVFLATGRQSLDRIGPLLPGRHLICRVIDTPTEPFPYEGEWVVGRPPFSETEETALFQRLNPDFLVVKNAGGAGRGKLDAARSLGIPIAMIARPPAPEGVDRREQLLDALEWAETHGDTF
jgi:precorrin-6x reductase